MDFTLSPEIEEVRLRTRRFVEEHVIALEADRDSYDEHENIRLDLLRELDRRHAGIHRAAVAYRRHRTPAARALVPPRRDRPDDPGPGCRVHRDDAVGGFYLFRLIPPRPSFPFDITDHERRVMEEHAAYWRDRIAAGDAFVAGPVHDPAGVWGLCVVRAKDEAAMKALRDEDPAIRRAIGMRYEVVPMLSAITPA